MPIRIAAAARLAQACSRPSPSVGASTLSRTVLAQRPPRLPFPFPFPPQLLLPLGRLHSMSSSSSTGSSAPGGLSSATSSSAATSASPAPAPSTSPRPGSSPSPLVPAAGAGAAASTAEPTAAAAVDLEVDGDGVKAAESNHNKLAAADSSSAPEDSNTSHKPLPALPSPEDAHQDSTTSAAPRVVQVNGQPVALDALGPMVVGRDGTVSRIANWHEMTSHEREATLRVLGKRNQLRLANLRAGLPADQKGE